MEELFRFSVIRAANRSIPSTVSINRPAAPTDKNPKTIRRTPDKTVAIPAAANNQAPQSFQDQLRSIVQSLSANGVSPATIWQRLEPVALNLVATGANALLTDPLWESLNDFITTLNNLASTGTGDAKTKKAISDLFAQQGSGSKNQDTLNTYLYDLGDLFVALLIIRRGGPSNIDRIIRSPNPQLWDLTELLSDKPSLQEISDRINAIDLINTGAPAVAAPAGATTPTDIQAAIQLSVTKAMSKTVILPKGIFAPFEKPIHGIGFREFHVVKQHIRGYQLGEISRIENILKGESRDHATKHTLTNDTTTATSSSTTTENDKELDNTDHVDIKNEADNQVKEDTKIDAGVHASYDGGSYKIQADLTVAYDKSSDNTRKFASDVSKDVTQKAVSKVTQTVTQSQTVQIIETFEEREDQSFDNTKGAAHISGVYQWVEKVYLAQTFNLGRHMLFDMMVPEPAAALLALATIPAANQAIPLQPDPLGTFHLDVPTNKKILDNPLTPDQLINAATASAWIAKYQVTGVTPYPSDTVVASKAIMIEPQDDSIKQGADTIIIPDGYMAVSAVITAGWWGNDNTTGPTNSVNVSVGNTPIILKWPTNKGQNANQTGSAQLTINEQGSIAYSFITQDVTALSMNIEIQCVASTETIAAWRLSTYEKIVAAYQKLETAYETALDNLQFQTSTVGPLGAADAPANRLTERMELKRSCIALIDNANETVRGVSPNIAMRDWPAPPVPPAVVNPSDPNQPSLPEPVLASTPNRAGYLTSQELGNNVRWFEQAFEWENMAYVFYPYYWGRRKNWLQQINLKNDDPLFLNFLQAGYARVVVPVRLGFEKAVHFYLHCGLPWLGGGLPSIGDKTQNPLYLDIAEEIKDMTGGNEQEENDPVGDPWDITLPTTLTKLRKDDTVPSWSRIGPDLKTDSKNYPSDPPVGAWAWSEDKAPAVLPYTNS